MQFPNVKKKKTLTGFEELLKITLKTTIKISKYPKMSGGEDLLLRDKSL